MCTPHCVRPGLAQLTGDARQALADLYMHPVVRTVAKAFAAAGADLFVVGGPTRGALRGERDFADLDFTTALRPEQMRPILARFGTIWGDGEQFGTLAVNVHAGGQVQKVEVTTFRTETYDPDSRKPTVGFGDRIEQDLLRRDLTVNAIAMNVVTGCLIDPCGGIPDLAAGVLDTPDDPDRTFTEDPLRMLRVIRFAARLEFAPTPRVTDACRRNAGRMSIVSAERCLGELDKLAGAGTPVLLTGLALADLLGLLTSFVPAADNGDGRLSRLPASADVDTVVAALLADLPAGAVTETTAAMKLPTARSQRVAILVGLARTLTTAPLDRPVARGLLRQFDDATLAAAASVAQAVTRAKPAVCGELDRTRSDEPGVRAPLPITGRDLLAAGLTGPAIGAVLRAAEQQFRSDGALSRDDALALV
jgi:hypothetical protein